MPSMIDPSPKQRLLFSSLYAFFFHSPADSPTTLLAVVVACNATGVPQHRRCFRLHLRQTRFVCSFFPPNSILFLFLWMVWFEINKINFLFFIWKSISLQTRVPVDRLSLFMFKLDFFFLIFSTFICSNMFSVFYVWLLCVHWIWYL